MKQVPISKTWAEDTENKIIPTEQETANGINFQAQIESDVTNGFVNQLYEAVKYEQRTGGYYNSFIPYEINSTVKILVNENGNKSILSLLRISGNEESNRPPYTGATETDVNGVIEWAGGTFNSVYWKEIESKSLLERDKPIADTGSTITFDSSGTIVLTNTATTRTISSGLWVGQTATLFNSTANTITITDGSNTFEIPTQEVFTLTWNGTKWATLKYKLEEIFVQLPFQKSPDYFDNGTWEDVTDLYGGAYFRALGGSSEAWEVLQKEHLPNIWGSVQAAVDAVQLVETKEVDGIFVIPEVSTKPTASSNARTLTAPFGIKTDASVLNYGTEENPIYIYTDDALKQHVNADNYGIRIWKKTAY